MKIPENPRIVLAGSVNSSRKTLEKLIEHEMNITGVLGLSPESAGNVSGFNDLQPVAREHHLNFTYFRNINEASTTNFIEQAKPDLLFVIGLSQLVKQKLIDLPAVGCVGYHPTMLPEGRGRAAIAWIIFGKAKPAATFFMIDEGVDSGDIIGQLPVSLEGNEYPREVIDKIMEAIGRLLDDLLPKMKSGHIHRRPQDETKATYLGRRKPEDGLIDWSLPASDIALLVRAVSKPLPGAFTFVSGKKLTLWKADASDNRRYIGEPGRVASVVDDAITVHAGEGVVKITDFEGVDVDEIKAGVKLGIDLLDISKKMNLIEW